MKHVTVIKHLSFVNNTQEYVRTTCATKKQFKLCLNHAVKQANINFYWLISNSI